MLIDYKNVELRQEERTILTGIDLQIRAGEFVFIMGEVGSGKSTLLKSIYGELPVAEGEATVLDTNMCRTRPHQLPALRKQLGIIFQDFQLLRDRTVHDNLDFVLRATGWGSKAERERRIKEVLEQVGLPDKANRMPHELSGGEQQSICIARAVLNKPRLLLADEPTANLDMESSRKVMRLLNDIREEGAAVILSTHNAAITEMYAGRQLRCVQGRLEELL